MRRKSTKKWWPLTSIVPRLRHSNPTKRVSLGHRDPERWRDLSRATHQQLVGDNPLEPSTIVSCQTSRLTSQKAAYGKRDGFSGKERSCWHNGPGKPNIITPVQKDHNSSVWAIPWISSKEGSGTRRPELRTEYSPGSLYCSPASSSHSFLSLGFQTKHNHQVKKKLFFSFNN